MIQPETATSVRLRWAEREIMALKLERDQLKAMVRLLLARVELYEAEREKIRAMYRPDQCELGDWQEKD